MMEVILFKSRDCDGGYRLIIRDSKRRKLYAWKVVSGLHKIPSKLCIKRIIENEPTYSSYGSERILKDICWKKEVYEDSIS